MSKAFNKGEAKEIKRAAGLLDEAKVILDEVWQTAEARLSARSDKYRESDEGQEHEGDLSSLEDIASTVETVSGDLTTFFDD
jgi:hypothetical protein